MNVTMFQMNFGESILLGEDKIRCLLVDCGSKSSLTASSQMLKNVQNQVALYQTADAMISHFHSDHYKGFRYFNHTFDRVYIPHIFTAHQHPNMVDYLLMRDYLRSRGTIKCTLLDLLENMQKIGKRFSLLKRGDHFSFCGNEAEVLWPCPQTIHNELESMLKSLAVPDDLRNQIRSISDEISEFVVKYANVSIRKNGYQQKLIQIRGSVRALMQNSNPDEEAGKKENAKKFHWDFPHSVNDHTYCIVFQIHSASDDRNYLFTGDVLKKHLTKICNDKKLPLYPNFYAVKAPHHGTPEYYCSDLFQNNAKIKIEKVFISHGQGYGNYGKISVEYIKEPYKMICTNYVPAECPGFGTCRPQNCGLSYNPPPTSYFI